MVWINEIESAKTIADLKTLYSITGTKLQTHFEVLHSKTLSGLKKGHQWIHQEKSFIEEEAAQKAFSREGGQRHRGICLGLQ